MMFRYNNSNKKDLKPFSILYTTHAHTKYRKRERERESERERYKERHGRREKDRKRNSSGRERKVGRETGLGEREPQRKIKREAWWKREK